MSYEALGIDSLLQVLSYVNVQGLARMSCTSRLGTVMAHEAQQRPSLLVLQGSLEDLRKNIRERLSARPTIAFVQYCEADVGGPGSRPWAEEVLGFVRKNLPPETEVLGAQTESIQCLLASDSLKQCASTRLSVCGPGSDNVSVLLATLPEASARAFHVKAQGRLGYASSSSEEEDEYDFTEDEDEEQDAVGEQEHVQESAPDSDAVPQPCADVPDDAPQQRGTEEPQAPQGTSAGASSTAQAPSVLGELLNIKPAPEVIILHIGSRATGIIERLQAAYPQAAIIGGVVMGQHVLVRGKSGTSSGRGIGVLAISGNVPLVAMTCPCPRGARAAMQDVRQKMKRAREIAIERERSILGALLFTCNGRGRRMFGREASDAALFQAEFKQAQLMGYYAGGEVGPAIDEDAPDDQQNAFLRGNAQLQGFTAVYGLFLVPQRHAPSAPFQRAVLYGEVEAAFHELRRNCGKITTGQSEVAPAAAAAAVAEAATAAPAAQAAP